jgi:hypothetical protein
LIVVEKNLNMIAICNRTIYSTVAMCNHYMAASYSESSKIATYPAYISGLISNAFILRNSVLLLIPSSLAVAVLLPLFRRRA